MTVGSLITRVMRARDKNVARKIIKDKATAGMNETRQTQEKRLIEKRE